MLNARLPLWLVLAAVAAAYVGVPAAGFVWDDQALIVSNRVLDAPTFDNVWREDLWCCTDTNSSGYYRPLLTVTFLLDHALYGKNPAGFHVTSLLLHLGVVALVAGLLRPRLGDARAAVAALIFGLHPVQSEAVVWVAARNDLLAAAGVLGALLALDSKRPAVAALAAFAAGVSKENAFLLPAVLWVWRRAWGERVERTDAVALGAGLAAAFVLRSQAALETEMLEGAELGFGAAAALHGLVTVLGWFAWPWPLTSTATVYMAPPGFGTWAAALATVVLLAALIARGGWRAFWLLALGAGVLAPSALGYRAYGTLGERYVYLALFGVVAAVVATVPARRWSAAALLGGAVASLGALHARVPDWATEETLFEAAVRRAPDSYAFTQLALELARQKRWTESTIAFDRAIGAAPLRLVACQYAVPVASRVLTDADLLDRADVWAARGCRGKLGFDGARAHALAARGLWAEAEVVARGSARNDVPKRRDEVVLAAVDERAGDFTSAGARAVRWPGGAADLRSQATALLQRPLPDVTP